jgi:ParB family transcriptional regulator, chromosome partitioning protein
VSEKRKALGRGLSALLPGAPAPHQSGTAAATRGSGEGLRTVPIEEVHPSASQPRKSFDDDRLGELAESIRVQGIIQPLVVRERGDGGYELVAGERRWRAAQRAGLHEVPVVVREVAPARAFEMALVENLQREDLNPIEEAEAYQRLVAEFGYTQESLAARVGKDRSTVANALRLLRLPAAVRALVIAGRLGMGHARALLGLDTDQVIERVARQTVSRALSVRQVESLVRRERTRAEMGPALPARQSAAARDLTERLQRALGARVRLVEAGPGRGHLEIHYGSLDELDSVLAKILPPS